MRGGEEAVIRTRRLGDVLADATVAAGGCGQEDIDASRRRIERDIADHGEPAFWPVALVEQSSQDLRALSALVVKDARAARDIAGLVNSERIEPAGALIFACLLHLSGRTDGAQFWWEFSAGAGQSTAALCLYLLHLQRGETRDADHWAAQATELELLEERAHRRPRVFYARTAACRSLYQEGYTTVESMLLRTLAGLSVSYAASGDWWRCAELAAAMQRLDVRHDRDFGSVPRPDPGLAGQLEG